MSEDHEVPAPLTVAQRIALELAEVHVKRLGEPELQEAFRVIREVLVAGNKVTVSRMWVNQPSKLQALHRMHGFIGLALDDGTGETVRFYPYKGETISMQIPRLCLSKG